LGDTLVTIPGFNYPVALNLGGLHTVKAVRNLITGERTEIRDDANLGPVIDLTGKSAFEIEHAS